MSQPAAKYDPTAVEDRWYRHWMESGYFHSEPDEREPYTIVIPPPNVTGVLHMGHILNNTIQDVLIRKARMQGKNACWVPGTDHASIATEAKVVGKLREQGIRKSDLSRDEFMRHAWDWKEKHGGIILEQLKKLGCSCDWDRTRFTMDPEMSDAVLDVFIDLYEKGFIYRGLRMINWDPAARTALSNEEVVYQETQGNLYHVRYQVEGTDGSEDAHWVTVATTRPETILGDTALSFHPDDERYTHLKGQRVIVPLIERPIPLIYDSYVDIEFGTGALKVTPAHDPNDYELGKKHDLETIDVITADGKMSEAAQRYIGEDRFEARKRIVADLKEAGHLVEIEPLTHSVGYSERTHVPIEPRLSLQWFMDMNKLAGPALEAIESDTIRIVPPKFKNTYRHWMTNIREWCISRQLWWGQRIPAWFYGEGDDDYVVARTAEQALEKARKKSGRGDMAMEDLHQDPDVLDTWASSWLWPISVFDGFAKPDGEIAYYYPTDVLVTAPEILFFWVARMIMAGYEYRDDKPFKDVYLTGIVRDKLRRKMSKSLGNSPDPLHMIDDYGADAVRIGMLFSSPAGNDILFDEKLCGQGRNFANKIWNAFRLVNGWNVAEGSDKAHEAGVRWFAHKFDQTATELERLFSEYRISEALKLLYSFIWDDFCSWYLEFVKPGYGQPIDRKTYEHTIVFFEGLLKMLHPFMPFLTEELWHALRERSSGQDIIVAEWPTPRDFDEEIIREGEMAKAIISSVRDLRNKNGISHKDPLKLHVQARDFGVYELFAGTVGKIANLSAFDHTTDHVEGAFAFIANGEKFYLQAAQSLDPARERERIEKDLDYQRGFLATVDKKLSNERFVSNAPEAVVAKERKKRDDAMEKIRILEDSLERLAN